MQCPGNQADQAGHSEVFHYDKGEGVKRHNNGLDDRDGFGRVGGPITGFGAFQAIPGLPLQFGRLLAFPLLFNRQLRYRESEGMMKTYECNTCGFLYDESEGLPDEGIPPGTRWEDIPDDWVCPECGATKWDFAPISFD